MSNEELKERREVDSVLMAVLRTELANRRTLLAYMKTALGMGGIGGGLMKFADTQSIFADIGLAMIPVAFIVLILGIIDFLRTQQVITAEKKKVGI